MVVASEVVIMIAGVLFLISSEFKNDVVSEWVLSMSSFALVAFDGIICIEAVWGSFELDVWYKVLSIVNNSVISLSVIKAVFNVSFFCIWLKTVVDKIGSVAFVPITWLFIRIASSKPWINFGSVSAKYYKISYNF